LRYPLLNEGAYNFDPGPLLYGSWSKRVQLWILSLNQCHSDIKTEVNPFHATSIWHLLPARLVWYHARFTSSILEFCCYST